MGKKDWKEDKAEETAPEQEAAQPEMSLEEAKAYRRSLHKPIAVELTEEEKKEEFRKFWAGGKRKYGKSKDLEEVIWAHLKSSKMDSPEQFEAGIAHFGLKKVK